MGIVSLRTVLLGLASWALPFAASFAFIDRTGQLLIAQPLFKSLMVVIGGGTGAALLALAFKAVRPTAASGLWLGLAWLAINIALDLAVLLPMSGMSVALYLQDIGLRYLLLPIIAVAIGFVAERRQTAER